jgi:hypothetical protein
MNVVTEIENELVNALLVEKRLAEKINFEHAVALIDKVKLVLERNSVVDRETTLPARKATKLLSH